MVALVLVSHSAKLAEGLQELIAQMQPGLAVRAAGGMPDGSLGTSAERIFEAIAEVDNPEGVLLLLDLGSAAMNAEVALEWLSTEQRERVVVSDAPLVEGAILVAIQAGLGLPLAVLAASAQEARHFPKHVAQPSAGPARPAGREREQDGRDR